MKCPAMLAVFAVCVLDAQPPSLIRNVPFFKALDTDHNGVISAAEIAAAPESLRTLDRDEDGFLSAEECAEDGEHGPSSKEMVQTLMAFDKNGDGKLQREEVPERMRGMFDRGDLNHDGVLTMDEIQKLAKSEQASRPKDKDPEMTPELRKRTEMMIMRVIPVLAALDTDHDGFISESEMRNAAAILKTFDKNGDGQLTDDEVSPDWARVFVAQGMVQLDTDGDGRISQEEMANPKAAPFRGTLMAADRNHKGYVTEEDLLAELRLRADSNHDGVVTQEEIQRAMQSGALAKPAEAEKQPGEVPKK